MRHYPPYDHSPGKSSIEPPGLNDTDIYTDII